MRTFQAGKLNKLCYKCKIYTVNRQKFRRNAEGTPANFS